MQKKDLVEQISVKTGIERPTVKLIVEGFMEAVQEDLIAGENIYLRGFGSFVIKKRKQKAAWHIGDGKPVMVPAHCIPAFNPNPTFVKKIKKSVNP